MATVYDKSSLFLAPSGVSNGTVFVQKPVPIYGSEQVTNGDFSQTGAELVTNGDFATDSDWFKSSFWTISGGAASMPSTPSYLPLYQNDVTIAGKTYVLNFDIVSITGIIKAMSINNGAASGEITLGEYSTTGNKKIIFTADSGREAISFARNFGNTASCSIDNVSVKEVGQDWTLGTGWSIGEDKAINNGTSAFINSVSNVFISGKTYKVGITVSNRTTGQVSYPYDGSATTYISSNGYFSQIYTPGDTNRCWIYAQGGFDGSITNISVQEVLSPDGDFTFTRGSNLSATRVNEAQLIEKGRENLVLQSNQFDTTWITSNAPTLTSGQSGYDGTNDAWKMEASSTGSSRAIYQNISSSGVQTFSVYVKAGTTDWIRLNLSGIGNRYFDIGNGVVGGSGSIDGFITDVGDGWYRCSVLGNGSSSGPYIFLASDNGNLAVNAGDNVYIQDAQLEQGLVATSVITTGAGTVQAGILENTPRLDYSGGATCPSLLLEPSRSNLVVTSEYAGGSGWFISSAYSVSQNVAISPEGVQNAFELTIPSTNGNTRAIVSVSPSTEYTFSFYVKRGTATELKYSIFNLTNNSNIIAQTSYYSQTSATEWKRIEVTFTTPAGCTSAGVYIDRDSQADGTAFFYGAQCEAGSYATSYIPTYGTSQTRAQEVCENGGSAESINSVEGVAFVECSFLADDVGENRDFYISDGTATNRIRIRFSSSDVVNFLVYNGSVQADINYTLPNPTNNNKIAVKWKANDFALWVNGTERGTDTSGTTFSTNTLDDVSFFTTYNQSQIFHSNVKQVAVFNEALSNLDLAILTGATTYETFDEMALALNYTVYE